VLIDEINMTQDELQGFLNGLCYTHQIVNSAISLPEPIYQADELAKRGRNNFLAMKWVWETIIFKVLNISIIPVLCVGASSRKPFHAIVRAWC
jgi:hypothetical protein